MNASGSDEPTKWRRAASSRSSSRRSPSASPFVVGDPLFRRWPLLLERPSRSRVRSTRRRIAPAHGPAVPRRHRLCRPHRAEHADRPDHGAEADRERPLAAAGARRRASPTLPSAAPRSSARVPTSPPGASRRTAGHPRQPGRLSRRHLDLAYSGTAEFTDATSTALVASPVSPASGQPVTLRATVTGANGRATRHPHRHRFLQRLPDGSLQLHDTSRYRDDRHEWSRDVHHHRPDDGRALPRGRLRRLGDRLLRLHLGGPDDHRRCSDHLDRQHGGSEYDDHCREDLPSTVSLAFTGADIAGMVIVALLLIGSGTFVVVTARRKRRSSGS